MANFKDLIGEIQDKTPKDLKESVAFREVLEELAYYMSDIDINTRKHFGLMDIVVVTLLLLNLMTAIAIYNMIR